MVLPYTMTILDYRVSVDEAWVPLCGMGFKSNQTLIDYSHKVRANTVLA